MWPCISSFLASISKLFSYYGFVLYRCSKCPVPKFNFRSISFVTDKIYYTFGQAWEEALIVQFQAVTPSVYWRHQFRQLVLGSSIEPGICHVVLSTAHMLMIFRDIPLTHIQIYCHSAQVMSALLLCIDARRLLETLEQIY